jgi:polyisoprenoid-binding protein YceI
MFRKVVTTFSVLALSSFTLFAADTFKVDKNHSNATFKVRHLISKVQGRFSDIDGVVNLDRSKLENSSVDFVIKTASIDTDNESRDKHLRSADFFDAEKYPTINFKSTKIVAAGNNIYNVTGNLTMRGVTKQITIPVELAGFAKDPWGHERAVFELSTTLNRKDFNINWNQTLDEGGYLLGDDVAVTINLEAVKQTPAAPPAK